MNFKVIYSTDFHSSEMHQVTFGKLNSSPERVLLLLTKINLNLFSRNKSIHFFYIKPLIYPTKFREFKREILQSINFLKYKRPVFTI